MRAPLAFSSALLLAACSGSSFTGRVDGDGGGRPDASGGASVGGTSTSAGGTTNGGGGPGGTSAGGTVGGSGGLAGSAGGASAGGAGGARGAGGDSRGGAPSMGGSGGAVGSADAGPPPILSCTPTPPDPAAICKGTFACSYGSDPRVACRSVYECHNGRFLVTAAKCPPAKSCIDDYTLKPFSGNACDPLGDYCMWDNGSICSCNACASMTTCKGPDTWDCGPPVSSPCPAVPPNEGQPCDGNSGGDCKYGECGIPSYILTHCKSGFWTWDFPVCG